MLDGAHNPSGARALAAALADVAGGTPDWWRSMSVLDDKDAAEMLATLLPIRRRGRVHAFVATAARCPPATLESLCAPARRPAGGASRPTPAAALERARALAGPDGAVLVTGSIYLLSDLVARSGVAGARP